MIKQKFSEDLLLGRLERLDRKKEKILALAKKKIRPVDVKKKINFERYLKDFEEVYERKKTEKAEFEADCKKKNKERPRLSNATTSMRFERYTRD